MFKSGDWLQAMDLDYVYVIEIVNSTNNNIFFSTIKVIIDENSPYREGNLFGASGKGYDWKLANYRKSPLWQVLND